MTDRHDNVDHTLEAVSRLRRIVREHDARGAEDTPFHLGIREALHDLDARADEGESSAA
jgi:hypothetical protein